MWCLYVDYSISVIGYTYEIWQAYGAYASNVKYM